MRIKTGNRSLVMPAGRELCGCGDRAQMIAQFSLPLLLGVLDSTTALGNPGQYSLPVNFHHVTVERSLEPSAGLRYSPLILVVGSPSLLVPLVHCQIIFHFAGLIRTRSLSHDFCLFLTLFSAHAIILVTFVQR